jgi:multiple sugar transport system substrate-binding protein
MRKARVACTLLTLGAVVLVLIAGVEPPQSSAAGAFAGVVVSIVTFTGPQIAEPLQRRAPDFQKLTGAKVNVITVPFSDLYQKILTDAATGTNSFDAYEFDPQWIGDFATAGYLEDLTPRVKADRALQWDDILPFFRNFNSSYQGKVYTVPTDGDLQMVYYRSDVLARDGVKPPATWADYLAIAKKYQGKDLSGDGKAGFGSCVAMKRSAQSYWMFLSVLAPYLQSRGTSQGAFFDSRNMDPLINNAAAQAALNVYQEMLKYGPPDQLNLDVGDTRGLFTSGRCALGIDWGDIGPLATDPKTSKVNGKVGSVITPGSTEVLDRGSGKLVPCTAQSCPYAIGGVNHAPFAAYGGWSCAINKAAKPRVKDAAYAFCSYLSQPAQSRLDVTIGTTGFNPYRKSHFGLDLWIKSGMTRPMAQSYVGAISQSLNSPNVVLDLRIPQNAYYEGVVLDTALAEFLAGQLSAAQTMKQIEDGWNKKTGELGRSKVLSVYRASLNIAK